MIFCAHVLTLFCDIEFHLRMAEYTAIGYPLCRYIFFKLLLNGALATSVTDF